MFGSAVAVNAAEGERKSDQENQDDNMAPLAESGHDDIDHLTDPPPEFEAEIARPAAIDVDNDAPPVAAGEGCIVRAYVAEAVDGPSVEQMRAWVQFNSGGARDRRPFLKAPELRKFRKPDSVEIMHPRRVLALLDGHVRDVGAPAPRLVNANCFKAFPRQITMAGCRCIACKPKKFYGDNSW